MEWTEKFEKWFKEGKEEEERYLDWPWDTEVEKGDKEDVLTSTHPKVPFGIRIYVTKHWANLYIDPGIPTDTMSVEERMRTYRKLLRINTDLNLMKTGLAGDENRVVLAVDLDLASLNNEEFSDALGSLIIGSQKVVDSLGLEEELSQLMFQRTAAMAYEKITAGESEEEVTDFLIQRVGLDEDYAKEFMDNVLKAVEEEKSKAKIEADADEVDLGYIR